MFCLSGTSFKGPSQYSLTTINFRLKIFEFVHTKAIIIHTYPNFTHEWLCWAGGGRVQISVWNFRLEFEFWLFFGCFLLVSLKSFPKKFKNLTIGVNLCWLKKWSGVGLGDVTSPLTPIAPDLLLLVILNREANTIHHPNHVIYPKPPHVRISS